MTPAEPQGRAGEHSKLPALNDFRRRQDMTRSRYPAAAILSLMFKRRYSRGGKPHPEPGLFAFYRPRQRCPERWPANVGGRHGPKMLVTRQHSVCCHGQQGRWRLPARSGIVPTIRAQGRSSDMTAIGAPASSWLEPLCRRPIPGAWSAPRSTSRYPDRYQRGAVPVGV